MSNLLHVINVLDLAAAMVFAITGALIASRKGMDIVGFLWLGVATGVGGGSVRDLLLGLPVFWVLDPTPIGLCLVASCVVYFTAHFVVSYARLLQWLDAFGMALVTVVGAAKSIDSAAGPFISVVMGVITASVGGIIRDVLGQEASIVLRKEVYVTASAIGASVFTLMSALGFSQSSAMVLGASVAFVIRSIAISLDWSLPFYHPKPGSKT